MSQKAEAKSRQEMCEMCATHIAPEDAPAHGEQGAKSDEAMAMYL